jgi:DNA-binding YbaB/EbfC family protein
MQLKMKKVQEELATKEFEGTSGGGAIQVKVTGDNKLVKVTISPEVMKSEDVEMLQDLILAATNDAIRLAKDTSQKEMDKVTGGLNIPGMF